MRSMPEVAPEVKIGDWLSKGWQIFVSDVGMFILASLIYTALNSVCFPILFGPLTCGMYIMIFDRMEGGKVDIKRLFEGFDFFLPSFLAGLIFFGLSIVGFIVTAIGFTLCVIPAILGIALLVFLQTVFLFVFQLIVREGVDATEAISLSFEKIKENLWQFLLFGFILWLINAGGYSVILGWLLTTPLALAASAAAYRDLFELEEAQHNVEQPEQI